MFFFQIIDPITFAKNRPIRDKQMEEYIPMTSFSYNRVRKIFFLENFVKWFELKKTVDLGKVIHAYVSGRYLGEIEFGRIFLKICKMYFTLWYMFFDMVLISDERFLRKLDVI